MGKLNCVNTIPVIYGCESYVVTDDRFNTTVKQWTKSIFDDFYERDTQSLVHCWGLWLCRIRRVCALLNSVLIFVASDVVCLLKYLYKRDTRHTHKPDSGNLHYRTKRTYIFARSLRILVSVGGKTCQKSKKINKKWQVGKFLPKIISTNQYFLPYVYMKTLYIFLKKKYPQALFSKYQWAEAYLGRIKH